MKRRTLKELEQLLDPSLDIRADMDKANRLFASMVEPQNFMGADNYEIKYDKDFELNCIILREYANQPIKTMTVREYFTLIQYHNKRVKKTHSK